MKLYKTWLVIEENDEETGNYRDLPDHIWSLTGIWHEDLDGALQEVLCALINPLDHEVERIRSQMMKGQHHDKD